MKFDKEFKEAITSLPIKEKDKLLLRLLKKDINLVNQLYFELIENKSVDEKREEMESYILNRVNQIRDTFHTNGWLLMDMRYLSGDISEHVRTTKDKYGEAKLNLMMLNEILQKNNKNISSSTYNTAYKCCIYIIARTFKVLLLIKKLHEDYWIDFHNDLRLLGKRIGESDYLMNTCIRNGLDVNWLIDFNRIPDNIEQIHKDLRSRGFLK